jgi:hypothetical protein
MAMIEEVDAESVPPHPRARAGHFTSVSGVVKFAALAAVVAMVADALVAHAILWQNDPYWTYWVTDTFLIATIFGLGTAWFGAGVGRGAVLTAVQTLVLTVYYWMLSPIGLPNHGEWLDLQRTWVTGLPVHFSVYYLGYLTALWLWRRRPRLEALSVDRPVASVATRALATSLAIVAVVGGLQTLVLGEFPGLTWFVVRTVVLVPFTLLWWSVAGRDRPAAVAGGLTAAVLLATYGHYLGPVGLPDTNLRLVAQDLPPVPVHWLSYREEFLVMLPLTVLVALVVFVATSLWQGQGWTPVAISRTSRLVTAVCVVALVALGVVAAGHTATADERATVTSAGDATVEDGAYYEGDLVSAQAQMRLVAETRNTKNTPLPPHDLLELKATVTHVDGTTYEVEATQASIADPLGRWGAWRGVGLDRWHHGRSGIGTSALPATHSGVAVYALGDVSADGELIATGVPMHAATMSNGGLELHVGDPESPVPALPDGHLRVAWDQHDGDNPEAPERARNLFGGGLLAALLALAVVAVRSEEPRTDLT